MPSAPAIIGGCDSAQLCLAKTPAHQQASDERLWEGNL
jgi:hypothetical protein